MQFEEFESIITDVMRKLIDSDLDGRQSVFNHLVIIERHQKHRISWFPIAPQLVEEIFAIVDRLNAEEHVGFLVAEQNTNIALRHARYGYILENGRIVMDGSAADLRNNEDVKEFYLGLSATGKKSYRDVKHYRRRKRWLA